MTLGTPVLTKAVEKNETVEKDIPVELLERGRYQPRQEFNPKAVEELADSIRQVGILQRIIVRPKTARNNQHEIYEIIAGERRWRAAQQVGLNTVPCRVLLTCSDAQALQIALIENLEREDLNCMELAQSISRFVDEFDYTHEAVATSISKSRAEVTNLLRLLKLESRVKALLASNELSDSHGRVLLTVPLEQQYIYAREAVVKKWSTRALEMAIKHQQTQPAFSSISSKPQIDVNLKRLEQTFSDYLGFSTKIVLDSKNAKKGSVVIDFSSYDELEGIFERTGFNRYRAVE
jgi:ParB family chromosome partitioning protein